MKTPSNLLSDDEVEEIIDNANRGDIAAGWQLIQYAEQSLRSKHISAPLFTYLADYFAKMSRTPQSRRDAATRFPEEITMRQVSVRKKDVC